MRAKQQGGGHIRIAQVDLTVHLHEFLQLLGRAEPLDAALDITADRVAEVFLRDLLAVLGAPRRETQTQIDVDDALTVAGDLIEQPA
jgi:hypothetical protein